MPGRSRNLEIKAVDPDPHATLTAALSLGAEDRGVCNQRDTYFHAVQGRLKLREELRAVLGIADERLVAQGYADLLA